jgi:hypothetical protein
VTGIERAVTIRDHVLPLIRSHTTLKPIDGHYFAAWQRHLFSFLLRTPSFDWPRQRASPVMPHRQSVLRESALQAPLLRYRLDVWRGQKLLSVSWEDDGLVDVIVLAKPGEWEAEVLAL